MCSSDLKSERLTGYLEFILRDVESSLREPMIRIITPEDIRRRGCQLSLVMARNGKEIFRQLTAAGVIADWREPDVLRLAPVPLYNSFEDISEFGAILRQILTD